MHRVEAAFGEVKIDGVKYIFVRTTGNLRRAGFPATRLFVLCDKCARYAS